MKINTSLIMSLLAIIISIITLFLVIYPPIFKPNIEISTNYEKNGFHYGSSSNTDFLLYVYNGGNGPCVNMKLNFDENYLHMSLRPPETFYEYTDLKDEIKLDYNSTAFFCSGTCPFFVLPENELLIFDFKVKTWGETPNVKQEIPDKLKINVSCSNKFLWKSYDKEIIINKIG